jgi:hypothetical protein
VIRPCSDGNSGALPTPTGSDARKPRSSPAIGLHQRLVGPSRRDGQRARRHSRQVLVPLTFLLKSRSLRQPFAMRKAATPEPWRRRADHIQSPGRDENEVRRSAAEKGRAGKGYPEEPGRRLLVFHPGAASLRTGARLREGAQSAVRNACATRSISARGSRWFVAIVCH